MAASLAGTQTASASGFDTSTFGSDFGYAAGATPFALYYNPAALATTRKLHIAANLTLAFHGASFDRAKSSVPEPADAQGVNTGKAKVNDVLAVPAVAAAYHIGDFAVGLGVFVPYGGMQSWSGGGRSLSAYPGSGDGSARWHLIEGGISVLYAGAGASYTLRDLGLSFGASINLNYTTLEFTRALNPTNDDKVPEGRTYVDVSKATASFGLGVLYEAIKDKLWVGLSYQSPPGFYKDQKLSGEVRNQFRGAPEIEDKVELTQKLPDVIRFGVRARPSEKYELRLAADYTRWSVAERQCLFKKGTGCPINSDGSREDPTSDNPLLNQPRKWKDGFGVKAGGSYYFSPMWEGFGSFGFASNTIPMGTLEPSTLDANNILLTVGGRVRLIDKLGILLAVGYQHWMERDNTGKSQLFSYKEPSRLPDAGGVYNQHAVILNSMVEFYLD